MSGTVVNIPDVGQVAFPAGMSDADIEDAIKTKIIPQHAESAAGERGAARVTGANDTISAAGNSFAQGATLGYGDELGAAVRAALPGFSNWMMKPSAVQEQAGQVPKTTVSNAPTFGERYSEELANLRGQQKADEAAHPTATTGGKLAGTIASTALALPEMGGVAGAKMLGNAMKFGATGGALGAVQGFGEGEGGFLNRAVNAGMEGTAGAVMGAGIPVAGTVGRALMETGPGRALSEKVVSPVLGKVADALEYVSPKVTPKSVSSAAPEGGNPIPADSLTLRIADALRGASDKTGDVAGNAAVQRLALAMEQSKMAPEEALAKLSDLGGDGVLADLGQQFRSTAIGAKVLPGETRNLAEDVLKARDSGAPQRMVDAFTGGRDVPSMYTAENYLGANKRQVGADLYGQMRGGGLNVSGEMNEMLEVPAVKAALAQINEDAASTGTKLSPVEVMHRVKQKLNDTSQAAFNSGKPINKADMGNLANDWEAAFWKANPQAQAADQGYAHAASLSDPKSKDGALQLGRRFMQTGTSDTAQEVSPSALFDRFATSTPEQKMAFRLGATNAARDTANQGVNSTRALARKLSPDSIDLTNKIGQIYGPERSGQILQRAAAERTFADTSNSLLRGSQTAEKLGDAAELGNSRLNVTPHGITERLTEHLKDMVGRIENPNEAVLNRIGKTLLNPNQGDNEQIIEAIKKVMEARAKGTKIHAGAITAGASAEGNQ